MEHIEKMKTAILVAVEIKRSKYDMEYHINEITGLAEACNIEVIEIFTQKVDRTTPNYFIGTGKIEELIALKDHLEPDIIIFDAELSPLQMGTLEAALDTVILDRTMLILDIFATRAKSQEAILQVELAQLKYYKPRLLAISSSLDRQQGGIGAAAKGPGEKKIELNKRRIEDEIISIEKQLKGIEKQRLNRRKKRASSNLKIVSLVGYTNAGKSTVMNTILRATNSLEEKEVFEKDMLFATLDTFTRLIKLDDNKEFLLVDTVGFVSKLPHHLVSSFKSTLEDALTSDLLLHVIDISNDNYQYQKHITEDVLRDLEADKINLINVYNKIDKTDYNVNEFKGNEIGISAKMNMNIDELLNTIVANIFKDNVVCEMQIPFDKGHDYNIIRDSSAVISEEFTDRGYKIKVELSEVLYNKYKEYDLDSNI